jgi:hypothetical protein
MKAAIMAVCLLLVAVPCKAATYLELGNSPVASLMWEWQKVALGAGTGVAYSTVHVNNPFGASGKLSVVTFNPTITGQYFLNQDSKARSFLEMRVSKGVPISSGPNSDFVDQASDNWSLGVGFGVRSGVAEHLNIGGAADYSVTFQTLEDEPENIASGAGFRVFLQCQL